MEEVPNLINIGPTHPTQILDQHDFFKDFAYVFQMILWTKIQNLDDGTRAPQQRQEVY